MSYNYTDGDGLAAIVKTEPADSDQVATGAPALRQIKAYMKDAAGGLAKLIADVAAIPAAYLAADASLANTLKTYPAQVTRESAPQSIPVDGAPHQITFEAASINPTPAPFNLGANKYVAPVAGYYKFSVTTQFDNDTGTAAAMQVSVGIYKNGVDAGLGDNDNTPSPSGGRWFPGFGGLMLLLAANDEITLHATADDGVNTGAIDLTTVDFSIVRVPTP